jgi:hypothetical protein
VDCLRATLTASAFNLLARSWGAPFDPPATAGEVADLYERDQLGQIKGLGPRRHAEISQGLQRAGLTGASGQQGAEAARREAATGP